MPFTLRGDGRSRVRVVRVEDLRRLWGPSSALDALSMSEHGADVPTDWDGLVNELRATRVLLVAAQDRERTIRARESALAGLVRGAALGGR